MTPLVGNVDMTEAEKNNRFSIRWFEDENGEDGEYAGQDQNTLPNSSEAHTNTFNDVGTFHQGAGPEELEVGPLAFIESHRFQTLVALVIVANAIIIGFETDYQTPWWFWVEQALLIFFVSELSLRALHNGPHFYHPDVRFGNAVDCVIVMSGVLDMWMMPVFEIVLVFITNAKANHKRNPILQALGILRMLRIIRLVRLVKIVEPLHRLATGVMEAMQGMFWVLVFLGMLLYAVAIICTRLIGHGAVLTSEAPLDDDVKEIQALFHSVFGSMFVLFELMSCWSLIPLTPLFKRIPILKLLFVLFYIFAAWALLAVMTGVVSEKMIAVREQINSDEKMDSHKKGTLDADALLGKFRKADGDNSGEITHDEFDQLVGDAETMRLLMLHGNVNAQDLQDLFDWLDSDKNGTITVKEFVEGFRWLNEEVTPKSFVKLQEKLSSDLRLVEDKIVTHIHDRFDRLLSTLRQPLRKINAVTTQVQRLDATCSEMSNLLRERRKTRLTREGLAEAERRLSARIDALLEAIDTLAHLQKAGLVRAVATQDVAQPMVGAAALKDGSRGFAV